MTEYKNSHDGQLQERDEKIRDPDIGELCDSYPKTWAALMDKDYPCVARDARSIIEKLNVLSKKYFLLATAKEITGSSNCDTSENCIQLFLLVWAVCSRWGSGDSRHENRLNLMFCINT